MNAGDVRATLGWARYYLGLYWPDVSKILGCSENQARAWYSQEETPGPEAIEKIQNLQNLKRLIQKNFGKNSDRVRQWLNKNITDFGSLTPLSLLKEKEISAVMPVLSSTLPQHTTKAG